MLLFNQIVALVAFVAGILVFIESESAIHEIEALVCFCISFLAQVNCTLMKRSSR